MTLPTFINSLQTEQIFCTHTGHVSVNLWRLPDARLIWLNRRAMYLDPQYNVAKSETEYKQHILHQCAYVISDDIVTICYSEKKITGIADRYGGEGIGRNGGSGRAVFANGYHIKGIGRTSLVSPLTDRAHGSGGAYLEECAREAVLSEIVAAEFPHSSVPVLAIIDTGFVQVWETDNGPKPERRCLLVRPAFVRPAHFMRALDFIGHHHHDGMRDAQRVALTIEQACIQFGATQFSAQWEAFWSLWAEQLAYAYVHRLNHGGNSESNIALDGRLLDFGGMTALPSWARITVAQGGWPAGADMNYLIHAQQSAAAMLAKHLKGDWTDTKKWQSLQASAIDTYKKTVFRELLRVLGLSRTQVDQLLGSELSAAVLAAGNRLLSHYTREQFAIFDGMPEPHFGWEVPCFWNDTQPQHLQELRGLIELAVDQGVFGTKTPLVRAMWSARCHFLSQTRTGLFRDNIKDALYKALDGSFTNKELTENDVTRVINDFVLKHRIDSKFEPIDAIPIGFACGNGQSYALFKDLVTEDIFAIQEGTDDCSGQQARSRIHVEEAGDGQLKLASIDASKLAVHLRVDRQLLRPIAKQGPH
jgi:hypothetical protein